MTGERSEPIFNLLTALLLRHALRTKTSFPVNRVSSGNGYLPLVYLIITWYCMSTITEKYKILLKTQNRKVYYTCGPGEAGWRTRKRQTIVEKTSKCVLVLFLPFCSIQEKPLFRWILLETSVSTSDSWGGPNDSLPPYQEILHS